MGTKTFTVVDTTGTTHTVQCDYMFNNGGELVFRTGERGSSDIVAMFAVGQWISCVRAKANG